MPSVTKQIHMDMGDVVEVFDSRGNLVYRSSEGEGNCLSSQEKEEFCPWDVDLEPHVEELEQSEVFIKADKSVRDFCQKWRDRKIAVPGFDGSTVGVTVIFYEDYLGDVELLFSTRGMLRYFVDCIRQSLIDFDLERKNDALIRLLDDYICEDWPQETFQRMAEEVSDNYRSDTRAKAFFKHVYECEAMAEFRQDFERMISSILEARRTIWCDSVFMGEFVRERFPEQSSDERDSVEELIVESFWDFREFWPHFN